MLFVRNFSEKNEFSSIGLKWVVRFVCASCFVKIISSDFCVKYRQIHTSNTIRNVISWLLIYAIFFFIRSIKTVWGCRLRIFFFQIILTLMICSHAKSNANRFFLTLSILSKYQFSYINPIQFQSNRFQICTKRFKRKMTSVW